MYKISVVPVSSVLRLEKKMQERVNQILAKLNKLDKFTFEVSRISETIDKPEVLLILSGGTEAQAVNYLEEKEGPVILLAHPQDNSFAAALEILAYLQGMGRKALIVQLTGDWQEKLQELLTVYVSGFNLTEKRIGRMGQEGKTRYPFTGSPEKLIKQNWGPEIVDIPFNEIEKRVSSFQETAEAVKLAEEMIANSTETIEPDWKDITEAAAIYLALKEIITEYKIDAITVKCFDLLPVLKNTACYALAILNEDGVVAACEGDIITATGMVIARELTGKPSFMANPCQIDIEKRLITLAHCTIPRTMCAQYTLRSHFESGIGVAFQGKMYQDKYTLFRIGGANLKEMYTATTVYRANGCDENLCRTQLTLEFIDLDDVKNLLEKPLGNHHLVIRGEYKTRLMKYHQLFVEGVY
jgi:L-fucose isomerase-like protein